MSDFVYLRLLILQRSSHNFFVCAPPPLQAASGEDAAKAAWSAAAIELPSLLPSFANGPADVDKVLTQHEAKYLVA
jgi:hypothetical protein